MWVGGCMCACVHVCVCIHVVGVHTLACRNVTKASPAHKYGVAMLSKVGTHTYVHKLQELAYV